MGDEKLMRTISKATGRLSARKATTAGAGLHHDGSGLYLRVLETIGKDGVTRHLSRNWLYRYKVDRRPHWLGLGTASAKDGDGHVTLAEARQKAAEQRRLRWAGLDPLNERRQAKSAARLATARGLSFRSAAEQFIDDNKVRWENQKHAAQWRSTLEQYAYPNIGDLPIAEVDLPMVLKVLKQPVAAARGNPAGQLWTARPETASRVRGRLQAVLDWATVHKYRTGANPAMWKGHLDHLLPARGGRRGLRHHAAIHHNDIGVFMRDLRQQEGVAAEALIFTILCAARTGEVLGARPEEFDVGARVWTIPAARMKSRRQHKVPLSEDAFAIAEKWIGTGCPFVFPGRQRGKPLSDLAMLKVLERMNRADVTVHGFRSTFRDVEMALAHAIGNKVEAAYRRGDMLERRRQIMAAWATHCATVKPAHATGNVVAIGTGASGSA
jgi:integrase